jgi:hypothetical protein
MPTTAWLLVLTCTLRISGQLPDHAPGPLQDLLDREFLMPNGWGKPKRSEKQFKRHVTKTGESIYWNVYACKKASEAFQQFYDQLPPPADKEAVQRWLRTKIPVGMPAEEAQVFLLLGGFNSSERWLPPGGVPLPPRPAPPSAAAEANVILFYAKHDTRGWVMPYQCHVKVRYDENRNVTEVIVEDAKRFSKAALLLLPLHPF